VTIRHHTLAIINDDSISIILRTFFFFLLFLFSFFGFTVLLPCLFSFFYTSYRTILKYEKFNRKKRKKEQKWISLDYEKIDFPALFSLQRTYYTRCNFVANIKTDLYTVYCIKIAISLLCSLFFSQQKNPIFFYPFPFFSTSSYCFSFLLILSITISVLTLFCSPSLSCSGILRHLKT
jgi:hypothetical protein